MTSPPPIPANELDRLRALRELVVLDSAPEPVFDAIARLASELCGVPIALLSLVDAERQWFKANVGLPGINETPRDIAFCAHGIASDTLFEVPDATLDARFADNPLVTGTPDIRFYAGAPLVLPGGERIGTLCVVDRHARRLDAAQARTLQSLAAIATQALVMRRDLITRSLSVRTEYERALADSEARHRAIVEEQAELVSLARPDGKLVYVNPAYARHFGRTPAEMIGSNLLDHVEPADHDAVRQRIAEVVRSGRSHSSENRMAAADGRERWVAWTNGVQRDGQGAAMLHSVGRDVTDRVLAERALYASQAFLARTGRVAGVGGWEIELATSAVTWSEETRRIHEVADDYQPTLDGAIAFYAPGARPLIEAAVRVGMQRGQAWDLELPLITATGRHIWVRAVGEVEFEAGKPVRLVGAFQDITDRKALEQRLAEHERFVRLITDSLPLRIAYVDKDRRYRFVNLGHCRRFGREREQIIGRTRSELKQGSADAEVDAKLDAALAGHAQQFEFDELVDGQTRRIESRLIPDLADSGEVRGVFTTGIDITETAHTRRQLERQAGTLRAVTEAIPAIVAVVGADGRYRFVNSAFERWCGVPRERIVGRTLVEVLGRAEYERSRPWVERVLAGETVNFEKDYRGHNLAKHLAISYIPMWLDGGAIDGFIGVGQDITQRKQEESRLLQLTQRDALTGLLNRSGFEQYLEQRVQGEGGASLALLYIDLDRFKPINDTHGHPVGDQVLQMFAQRLERLVRPTDAVARLGGDEFALALAGVREAANARAVADKIVSAAQLPFTVGALRLEIGASVGVAFGADLELGWRGLLERADAMLYRAKGAGRGRAAGETRQ